VDQYTRLYGIKVHSIYQEHVVNHYKQVVVRTSQTTGSLSEQSLQMEKEKKPEL